MFYPVLVFGSVAETSNDFRTKEIFLFGNVLSSGVANSIIGGWGGAHIHIFIFRTIDPFEIDCFRVDFR